jgi:hypothetical protein
LRIGSSRRRFSLSFAVYFATYLSVQCDAVFVALQQWLRQTKCVVAATLSRERPVPQGVRHGRSTKETFGSAAQGSL